MSAYASLEIVTLVTAHEAGGGGINFALPIRKLRLTGQPLTKDHTGLVYSGAGLNPRSPVFLFIFFTLTCHHRFTCTVRSRGSLHRGGEMKAQRSGYGFPGRGPSHCKVLACKQERPEEGREKIAQGELP